MSDVVLALNQVSKCYKSNEGGEVCAMKDVSLSVDQGQWVGIVGESGSGKSTLARIVSRLEAPTKGEVLFRCSNIRHFRGEHNYYKHVQMIFQNPLATFSPRMTIGTYMIEPFLNFKFMKKKEAVAYSEGLLEDVGLDKCMMNRYPRELSGGQLQRVVIARAIGLKPDLLICDECTSALDVSTQKDIVELLLQLKEKKNFTVLFITHNLALAEMICNEIHVMKDGRLVESLGNDILRQANHPYTKKLAGAVYSLQGII